MVSTLANCLVVNQPVARVTESDQVQLGILTALTAEFLVMNLEI
jgi:hypothetical protein